jgi:hypothetical protein
MLDEVALTVTLHGCKGQRCPTQMQKWAFKMKITVAGSS